MIKTVSVSYLNNNTADSLTHFEHLKKCLVLNGNNLIFLIEKTMKFFKFQNQITKKKYCVSNLFP
jgi:hypothetical protein